MASFSVRLGFGSYYGARNVTGFTQGSAVARFKILLEARIYLILFIDFYEERLRASKNWDKTVNIRRRLKLKQIHAGF